MSTVWRIPVHPQLERMRKSNVYWRCVDCPCLGRATTDKNDQVITENHAHDHPPETAQATVARVVEKMKQRAKNETTTINTIYRETLQETRRKYPSRRKGYIVTSLTLETTP